MNIVIAQIRKDLIPLRGLLSAMGALLALTVAGRILEATGAVRSTGGNPLGGVQFLLVAMLVVRLIHLDSLADPDAFWRTRPIRRTQLLSAKAAFLVLPCLALLAIIQPWVADPRGLSFSEVCILLAGFAAFASVTRRFSEMAVLFFKAVLAALLTALAAAALSMPIRWLHLDLTSLPVDAILVGANVIVIAGYIGVVIHQYLTSRTSLSIRAIYGIFIFAVLVGSFADQLRN